MVLIDPISLNYMAGSEIDFVDDLIGSSFKVNNPNATASCGCGTSFRAVEHDPEGRTPVFPKRSCSDKMAARS